MVKTVRQSIIEMLSQETLSAIELSEKLGIKEKEIFFHLEHIKVSIKPKKILIESSYCKKCGFVFTKRDRFTPPSRCPRCKDEYIETPRFSIRE
jgi:predicted Zn-ribbon and HTH transcriptional regulator